MLSLVLSLLVFRRRRVSDDYCVVVSCAVWVLVWAVVRPGRGAHLVFMVFGLATNMIVTAMLLLGGSAVVTALTGMSTTAACLLTPLGVIVYTLHGGIKATFVSDYLHTALIFAIIITFGFTVYATSPLIGSPDAMFGLLKAAVKVLPLYIDFRIFVISCLAAVAARSVVGQHRLGARCRPLSLLRYPMLRSAVVGLLAHARLTSRRRHVLFRAMKAASTSPWRPLVDSSSVPSTSWAT